MMRTIGFCPLFLLFLLTGTMEGQKTRTRQDKKGDCYIMGNLPKENEAKWVRKYHGVHGKDELVPSTNPTPRNPERTPSDQDCNWQATSRQHL